MFCQDVFFKISFSVSLIICHHIPVVGIKFPFDLHISGLALPNVEADSVRCSGLVTHRLKKKEKLSQSSSREVEIISEKTGSTSLPLFI